MACSTTFTDVTFTNWFALDFQPIEGCPSASWELSEQDKNVIQRENGQPAFYCSDFNVFDLFNGNNGVTFTGFVQVEEFNEEVREECQALPGRDDDYFGFVFGYSPGDNLEGNTSADYVVVDWKARDQDFSESCDDVDEADIPNGCSPCVCDTDVDGWEEATTGLAVFRVTGGLIHSDEMWSHKDCDCGPTYPGTIEELQRGNTLSTQAWEFLKDKEEAYEFSFEYSRTRFKVFVDGVEQIDLSSNQAGGPFSDGRLCFYNYSQENVRYFAFESTETCVEPTPPPPPPPPSPPSGKGGERASKGSKATKGTAKGSKGSKGTVKAEGKGKGKGGMKKTQRNFGGNEEDNVFGDE